MAWPYRTEHNVLNCSMNFPLTHNRWPRHSVTSVDVSQNHV